MANKTSKKLNLSVLESRAKQRERKVKVQLDADTHVYIYPEFTPSKIQKMIQEILTDRIRAEKAGIEFDVNFVDWSFFSMIKYFADLGIPDDIEKKMQAFIMLIDDEYYEKITQAFPPESIEKVTKMLERVTQNINNYMQLNEEDQQKLIKDLSDLEGDEKEEVH